MLSHDNRWSLPRGNTLVPSGWQATQVEQSEWVEDLVARTTPAHGEAPAACVLDTGINRGHPLLERSLAGEDTHTCNPAWGASDDHRGHGTEMAGIALYGDLRAVLGDAGSVQLRHRLESVKILPPHGANPPDLYGAITAEGVARTEVQAPARRRAFCLAVTAEPDRIAGTPTSWSAAVDALAAGREFDTLNGQLRYIDAASAQSHRLFLISAGNVDKLDAAYLDRCDVEPVEDPAQAWNALTVGAYTDLVDVEAAGQDFNGWAAIAPPGDLSPFSRTSVMFQRQWPIKPEIVLEGVDAVERFMRRTITVSRQVQGCGAAVEIRAPKYGSERIVYAAAGLIGMLAEHVAAHCPGDDPGRWLFGDGCPVPPASVGAMWRRATGRAGCRGVHLHHLRHFYASGLIADGCDVVTVQRALGFQRDGDPQHLREPVAVSRGPYPACGGRHARRGPGYCGLRADHWGGVTS